jgi:hypothetical protein
MPTADGDPATDPITDEDRICQTRHHEQRHHLHQDRKRRTGACGSGELAPGLDKILGAIDGRSSVEDVRGRLDKVSAGLVDFGLEALIEGELIRDVSGAEPVSTSTPAEEHARKAQELRDKIRDRRKGGDRSRSSPAIDAWYKARREAEAQAIREAEGEAKRLGDEQAKRAEADMARRVLDEQNKRIAADQARRAAEEQAKRALEELAKREVEDKARRAAEEQARARCRGKGQAGAGGAGQACGRGRGQTHGRGAGPTCGCGGGAAQGRRASSPGSRGKASSRGRTGEAGMPRTRRAACGRGKGPRCGAWTKSNARPRSAPGSVPRFRPG